MDHLHAPGDLPISIEDIKDILQKIGRQLPKHQIRRLQRMLCDVQEALEEDSTPHKICDSMLRLRGDLSRALSELEKHEWVVSDLGEIHAVLNGHHPGLPVKWRPRGHPYTGEEMDEQCEYYSSDVRTGELMSMIREVLAWIPPLEVKKGYKKNWYHPYVVGARLPGIYEAIFEEDFPRKPGGKGFEFVKAALAKLKYEFPDYDDETLRTYFYDMEKERLEENS